MGSGDFALCAVLLDRWRVVGFGFCWVLDEVGLVLRTGVGLDLQGESGFGWGAVKLGRFRLKVGWLDGEGVLGFCDARAGE